MPSPNQLKKLGLFSMLVLLLAVAVPPQIIAQSDSSLTVLEIMTEIVAPTTGTIWGAYQLETDAEWQEIEKAALAVIDAGKLLANGGTGPEDKGWAAQEDWQSYNQQMVAAAREVIAAVSNKDEEALFNAGNDSLYPPCESCHQKYQMQ
jgi:cytochrome c556